MITIEQNPAGFMGSNMDHYFTLSSTNTALSNYKYVVDVYFNPYETTAEKIGRVKIRPNTYGKGIINVRDIIRNYITPNPRSNGDFYGNLYLNTSWNKLTNPTPNGNITFASGFTESNVLNETNPYQTLNHTGSYRIVVGEEYTSGSTTILNIQTNYWVPTDAQNITESLDTTTTSYPGVPNRINWSGMNSWDFGTNYGVFTSGYTYQHYQGTTLIASGTSANDSGNYVATLEPSINDVFYVWSNDLGCGFEFVWNCNTCETNGWNYVDTYSPTSTPICSSASDLVRLTPAAAPSTYVDFRGDAHYYFAPTTPFSNTDYMYLFYQGPYLNETIMYEQSNKGNFYNKFGTDKSPYTTNGITISSGYVPIVFRHRQHHKDCPIILNFSNGNLGRAPYNLERRSQVSGLVELRQTGNTNTLNYHKTYTTPSTGTTTNVYTNLDSLITNFTKFYWGATEFDNVKKAAFYTHRNGTSTDYNNYGTSNIYVYEFYGDECLYGDAVHFMYLNTNGAWDTITFGQKNIKSLSTKRDLYAQSGIRDASAYMWGSYEQRNITYNQDTIVSVEAQSAWVDENDVPNFRDFFLSNYVYQIIQTLNPQNAYGLITTLIPVTITDNTFEEYKQKYNKLYQYSMNYQYNTINQFNTSL